MGGCGACLESEELFMIRRSYGGGRSGRSGGVRPGVAEYQSLLRLSLGGSVNLVIWILSLARGT